VMNVKFLAELLVPTSVPYHESEQRHSIHQIVLQDANFYIGMSENKKN